MHTSFVHFYLSGFDLDGHHVSPKPQRWREVGAGRWPPWAPPSGVGFVQGVPTPQVTVRPGQAEQQRLGHIHQVACSLLFLSLAHGHCRRQARPWCGVRGGQRCPCLHRVDSSGLHLG